MSIIKSKAFEINDAKQNSHLHNSQGSWLTFSMDIPRDIPGNIPMLTKALRVLVNVRIFLGIFVEKRKKNSASLLEKSISTGYSRESQGYSSLNPAFFLFCSMDVPGNIPRLVRAFGVLANLRDIHFVFVINSLH